MAREQFDTLTEQMFYILLCLQTPKYGLKIAHEIRKLTNKRVNIGPGTLYGLLGRFENEGFIEIVPSNSNRKIYRITNLGLELLNTELDRLKKLIKDYSTKMEEYDA